MIKIKIKRISSYLLACILVFFLCFFIYLKKINPKLIIIANDHMKKNVYSEIAKTSSKVMSNVDTSNLINIYQNKDGEILYVNYNLNKCYNLLNNISNTLNNNLMINNIVLKEPFFLYSNSVFLSSLGPKLNVKINYINMSLSNIYTKITNYGMNNALVEVYVTINITGRIITPVSKNEEAIKYDMLISSIVINGRVPSFYGGVISTMSKYFDISFFL